MERYLKWHQQLMTQDRKRFGGGVRALPLICAVVGLVAVLAAGAYTRAGADDPRSGDGAHEVPAGSSGFEGHAQLQDETMAEMGMGEMEGIEKHMHGLTDAPAHPSSLEHFLADLSKTDLERGDADQEVGSRAVHWSEPYDLPVVAKKVLHAYEKEQGAVLATSGYLDISGNVWGAILEDGGAWCDMVLVSTEDGKESTARVVRLIGAGI